MARGLLFYREDIDGPWQSRHMTAGDSARVWATEHYHSGQLAKTSPVFFWTGAIWYYAAWDAYNSTLARGNHIPSTDVPSEIRLQALVLGDLRG